MLLRRNVAGQTVELGPLDTTGTVPLSATPYVNDALGAGTVAATNNKCWKYTFTQAETNASLVRLRLEQGSFGIAATFATLEVDSDGTISQLDTIQAKTDLINGQSVVARSTLIEGSELYLFVGSTKNLGPVPVVDESGDAVDLTVFSLKFCIATKAGETLFEYTPTVSGSTFTVADIDPSVRSTRREFSWSLRNTDDGDEPLAYGTLSIIFAAKRAS